MLLAELELWHSRPIAPTRRVALGRRILPVDPTPGFGGLLLGAVMAARLAALDPDLIPELRTLLEDLEEGRRIPQPRLRHRFQVDHIGLAKSTHRLLGRGDELELQLEDGGSAASQVLGAAYAAGMIDRRHRAGVINVLRRSLLWRGDDVGPELLAFLSGASRVRSHAAAAFAHPELWALTILGFDDGAVPAKRDVQRRFRTLLRDAHPDHGGIEHHAAQRIADLTEARDILLA